MKLRPFRKGETADKNHMSGCAIIDADWVNGFMSDVRAAASSEPDGAFKASVAHAVLRLIKLFHFGKRGRGVINRSAIREFEKIEKRCARDMGVSHE